MAKSMQRPGLNSSPAKARGARNPSFDHVFNMRDEVLTKMFAP